MKTIADPTSLDAIVPFWPVVEVDLGEPASVKVGGVTTPLEGDVQARAVAVAAGVAGVMGYPVRMYVSSGTGTQRLVVSPVGVVTRLPDEHPQPAVQRRRRFRR